MTPLVVVQARMGSTRLPGKVLAPIGDRRLIDLMFDRLDRLDADVVLATSDGPGDDVLAEWADGRGIPVGRGPEADVLSRFASVLDDHGGDPIVRLTADCPLIDPEIVLAAVAAQRDAGADYTGNTLIRTFPDGLDVEVMSRDTLLLAHETARDPEDREHVTRWIIQRPDRFTLVNLHSGFAVAAERWTVDTEADLGRVRQIVSLLDDPVAAGWRAILERAGRTEPDLVDVVQSQVSIQVSYSSAPTLERLHA